MLNQIIYTRCFPHRDLEDKGQVVRSDGFGVFSMSQDLVENPTFSNFKLLQAVLATHNGSSERSAIGLFNSYEYTKLSNDVFAIHYEVARPKCNVPRSNGIGHRPGTHIKQGLIGKPEDYPFMWFGASVWDAHLISENDYYLDEDPNAEPEWLNPVPEIANGSYINLEAIKEFVANGREEAVKAGIWFLINEFSKPESQRKVLLIMDFPENVELWIAAISYAFSVEMAREITFTTNKSKIKKIPDNILFYYTDQNGDFHSLGNSKFVLNRHPYHMIVGFHPEDSFCTKPKQMVNSNFAVIDGTTKTAEFKADETIQSQYYSAAVEYDADIIDFTSIVLPSLPTSGINSEIANIFDAYKYLLDSNHKVEKWTYSSAIYELNVLFQYGFTKNRLLNLYLLEEGLRGYHRFVEDDRENQFEFLRILWGLGQVTERTLDVSDCLIDILSNEIKNLGANNRDLTKTWKGLRNGDLQEIVHPKLVNLFTDANLQVYASKFDTLNVSNILTILDMFFEALSHADTGIASILNSSEKIQFVSRGTKALIKDENALFILMFRLKESEEVFSTIALEVSKYFEKNEPEKIDYWWNAIIEVTDGNIIDFVKLILEESDSDLRLIEHLLSNSIKKLGNCGQAHLDVFNKSIMEFREKKDESTGLRFYKTCIENEESSKFSEIIHSIRRNKLSMSVQVELFKLIDNRLILEDTIIINPFFRRDMNIWGEEIGQISVSLSLKDLLRRLENEELEEKVLQNFIDFIKLKLAMPNNFIQGQNFNELAQKASMFKNTKLHLAFLNLFEISDNNKKQEYYETYIDFVLSSSKNSGFLFDNRKDLAYSMLPLSEAIHYEMELPGKTGEEMKESSEMLKKSFIKVLPHYYDSKLIDHISRIDSFEENVKSKLISILNDVAGQTSKRGSKTFLDKLSEKIGLK